MILPGPIKKIIAVFRGNVSPVFIFISVLLGFWFGMLPGFSGFHILLIIVTLILNVHIGLFILTALLGRGLCFAAAPVLYHAGIWLHGNLSGMYRFLSSLPVIGLTDFNTYAVAGGFIIGPVVGVIAGLLLARSVISFRKMMLKIDEKSEKFRIWYSKTWVRILDWILIGKRVKDVKSMFVKTKYIRKAGVVLAILVIVGAFVSAHFLTDTKIKDFAAEKMTNVNGAQVDINEIGLSLLNGSLSAGGIQVTDTGDPNYNQLAVGKIATDASVYDLLLGKVYMEKVEVSEVLFGQKRSSPGKVVEREVAEKSEDFDPNKYKVDAGDIAKLEKYFKDAKSLKEKLQKIRQYLPSGKGDETPAETEQSPQNYLEYLTAKAFTSISPRFMAKLAVLDKVQIPSEMFGSSKIQLSNLSDAPEAAGLPVTIDMDSLETKASINMKIDYSKDTPELSGTFNTFDLSKMQSLLSSDSGLAFKSGTASGKFSGTATKQALDLTLNLDIKDLDAAGQGNGVLGLGRDVTNESLSVLDNLSTTIRIVGSVTEPRLVFDVKGLTDEFKQALAKAGKDRALKEFDERVGKKIEEELGDKLPGGIKETLKDPLKGLGGLLGGNKDE
ncbi:MAG: hypothetical protein JW787_00595 [Sedimentisphaerales bacterium]|nr:hypothetical protein [Sedimentisphaerales bacterium]